VVKFLVPLCGGEASKFKATFDLSFKSSFGRMNKYGVLRVLLGKLVARGFRSKEVLILSHIEAGGV